MTSDPSSAASTTGGCSGGPTHHADDRSVRHLLVDRDGVLNCEHPNGPVRTPDQWVWEAGALAAVELLAQAGLAVSVVTNQSAVARDEISAEELEALHRWVRARLEEHGVSVVGVFSCPHGRSGTCSCRKPEPGLLVDAIRTAGVSPDETVMVGDDLRDLSAAEAAGIRSILVRTGKGASQERFAPAGTVVADDLAAAVRLLLDEPGGPVDGR